MADRFDEMEQRIGEMMFQEPDEGIGRVAAYLRAEFGKEWIPVIERFPDDDGKYLVYHSYYGKIFMADFAPYARDFSSPMSSMITHWRPLPEPPKGEQTE